MILFYEASAIFLASTTAQPSSQQDKSFDLSGMEECRSIAASDTRAACYDRVYDAIARSIHAGDVALVDRRSEKATRRERFGLSGSNGTANAEGRLLQIQSRITGLSPNADGSWIISLTDGTNWRTASALSGRLGNGQDVTITKDQFSRYKMSAEGGRKTIVYRVK